MLFVFVRGLGFLRFISLDGGVTNSKVFVSDFTAATSWNTERELNSALNGDIAGNNFAIVRIEVI
jgi:hypothetical protein